MTTTKETKKAVQEAAERLEQARRNARRISDAMNAQPAAFDAQLLAKAREKVEDLGAAVMLGEAPPEALEAARREASDLEIEAAAAEFNARQLAEGRAGLERRLSEAQCGIEDAEQELIEATGEWLKAELAAADEAYTRAAEQLAAAHARVHAAGDLLSYRRACPNTTACALPLQLPTIGPVSLSKCSNRLNGGARTYMRIDSAETARNHLLTEFKNLGALWPVKASR